METIKIMAYWGRYVLYFCCFLVISLNCSCWGQLGVKEDCELRQSTDGNVLPHKVLLFIDSSFFDIFRNWMLYFDNVCSGENDYKNLELVCMDPRVDLLFNGTKLHCSKEYSSIVYDRKNSTLHTERMDQISMVWLKRLEIINTLLSKGIHLILSDTDAFWLRNPYPELNKHVGESQIISSRGWYPWKFSKLWGSTLCMGFLYVKADKFSIHVFHEVHNQMKEVALKLAAFRHYISNNETAIVSSGNSSHLMDFNITQWHQSENHSPDDQFSINQVLLDMGVRWSTRRLLNESCTGSIEWGGQQYSVTLLSERAFVRNCRDSPISKITFGRMRFPTIGLRNAIRRRLANATVAHCLIAPGDALKKQNYLVFYTLWRLPHNISAVIDYIRQDMHDMMKSNRRNITMNHRIKFFNATSNSYVEVSSLPAHMQESIQQQQYKKHMQALTKARLGSHLYNALLPVNNLSELMQRDHAFYDRQQINYRPHGGQLPRQTKEGPKQRPRVQPSTGVD